MKKIFMLALLLSPYRSFGDSWIQKASITGERDLTVGFSIGTKGYIGTGYNSGLNTKYQDFWEWDQATNVWTQKADFGGGVRYGAVGFSIGTKGYIGIGSAPSLKFDFWEYDPAINFWTQKADFVGNARSLAVGFSIGTKGYIGTGTTNGIPSGATQDFWEWDGDTASATYDTWSQKSSLPGIARYAAVGFSISTKGYIGTGADAGANLYNDFWEWDQASNTWSQKTNFGGPPIQAAAGFSIGIKGYIGTGHWGVSTKDFWEWDQATNLWTKKADFGGAQRSIATGFSIGNKGYIGMGFFFTVSTNDFWEYCDTCSGVGINEINNAQGIILSPNPVHDKLKISFAKNYENLQVGMYDGAGKKVFEGEFENINSTIEISVSKFKKGIYFLKLDKENDIHSFKLLVE